MCYQDSNLPSLNPPESNFNNFQLNTSLSVQTNYIDVSCSIKSDEFLVILHVTVVEIICSPDVLASRALLEIVEHLVAVILGVSLD